MTLTVAELAERIGAELAGDGSGRISDAGPLATASETEVTFIKAPERCGTRTAVVTSVEQMPGLQESRAGAVIVGKLIAGLAKPQLVVRNVDTALVEALSVFAPKLETPCEGINPSARVSPDASIGKGVHVGADVVIEAGVAIGAESMICSGCKLGENTRVGKNCRLGSNVVIYHNCTIGDHVVIQANSTIGSTGFGYYLIDGEHKLVPHNGAVVIEEFVEIGCNCCVDRAKFGNTVIGAGTKIENLVQIGHNSVIGKCCVIAGQVGISGSCRLGDGVVIAGQVGLVNNIEIGGGTAVGAQSGVMHDVASGQQIVGAPAVKKRQALRITSSMRRLPRLAEQLKQLSKRIEELEASEDNKE